MWSFTEAVRPLGIPGGTIALVRPGADHVAAGTTQPEGVAVLKSAPWTEVVRQFQGRTTVPSAWTGAA